MLQRFLTEPTKNPCKIKFSSLSLSSLLILLSLFARFIKEHMNIAQKQNRLVAWFLRARFTAVRDAINVKLKEFSGPESDEKEARTCATIY